MTDSIFFIFAMLLMATQPRSSIIAFCKQSKGKVFVSKVIICSFAYFFEVIVFDEI